jgi:hypothetical protein
MEKITEKMSEEYAQWILSECSCPIDEIQYLVSEILSNRDEQTKKKHLTEAILWINEL